MEKKLLEGVPAPSYNYHYLTPDTHINVIVVAMLPGVVDGFLVYQMSLKLVDVKKISQ